MKKKKIGFHVFGVNKRRSQKEKNLFVRIYTVKKKYWNKLEIERDRREREAEG